MALQDRKLGTYADNVKSLSDYPSDDGVTAEQLKAIFDGRTDKEVKNAINGVIDDLTVSTGAGEIRTTSGKSVQEELDTKVDKVSGKGLSTNDYTTAEKNKLAGVETGANKTVVDSALSSTSENPVQNKAVQVALDAKLDKADLKLQTPILIPGEDPTGIYEPVGKISVNEYEVEITHETATHPLPPSLLIGDLGLRYRENGVEYSVYTENNKPPVDSALSFTSENPVQNKTVQAALDTKVDKVSGKGLSTNDYTTAEKNKLAGMESGATNTVVDASLSSTSTNPVQNKTVQAALDTKVDKVSGKGLSTNDYTTAEKNKLAGVETGANKTVVDSALSSTSENPVQNKAVQVALDAKLDKADFKLQTPILIPGEDPTGLFEPVGKISVNEYEVEITHETATHPLPPSLLIGDLGLRYRENGVEYSVYTENNKPPVDSVLSFTSENPVQNMVVSEALDSKVNAQAGKGLSTNDYTTAEKQKLSGIAEGATKTIVDAALSATSENPVQNKAVKVALDAKANAANPQFSGTATINTSGAGELRVQNNAGFQNYVELSVTPGDEDAALELTLRRGNTAEIFDTGKIYTSYDPQPADSALSATSTNPVQNKVVSLALQNKANFENPGFVGDMRVQGGSTTSFSPALTVSVDDSRASMSYESSISPLPDKILFGDGRLAFHTGGSEYDVYTSNNPPTTICGFSFASMTQAEYDALAEKDANTLYIVTPGGAS